MRLRVTSKSRLTLVLVVEAVAILALSGLVLAGDLMADQWRLLSVALAVLLVIGVLAYAGLSLGRHFNALERLRGSVLTLAHDPSARLPVPGEETDPEVADLHAALQAWAGRQAAEQALPDQRIQAVLASVPDALLVITEAGQISLVNHAAKALLGVEQVSVGTSAYAVLSRTSLRQAIQRAEGAGRPVDAMIGTLEDHQLTAKVTVLADHGGAVITIPHEEVEFRAELDADLALHDAPPPLAAFDKDTPLASMPFLVLDTETTGLDVVNDRVISIGAVRLAGARIYRAASFDRLVNPATAIPPKSTAIHGITDDMVAEAHPFPEVYRDFGALLAGTVVVGHHIDFDLAVLKQECARGGLEWPEPFSLCTLMLAEALYPKLPKASLDGLAEMLGVEIEGRHTALGDALVTAEVFARLLPRLADRGVTTLGEALAFARTAKRIIQAQAEAGW